MINGLAVALEWRGVAHYWVGCAIEQGHHVQMAGERNLVIENGPDQMDVRKCPPFLPQNHRPDGQNRVLGCLRYLASPDHHSQERRAEAECYCYSRVV